MPWDCAASGCIRERTTETSHIARTPPNNVRCPLSRLCAALPLPHGQARCLEASPAWSMSSHRRCRRCIEDVGVPVRRQRTASSAPPLAPMRPRYARSLRSRSLLSFTSARSLKRGRPRHVRLGSSRCHRCSGCIGASDYVSEAPEQGTQAIKATRHLKPRMQARERDGGLRLKRDALTS